MNENEAKKAYVFRKEYFDRGDKCRSNNFKYRREAFLEVIERLDLILKYSVVKPSERRSPTDESFSGCKPPDERQNPQEKILACTCIYRTEKGKKIAIDKCEYCKQEFLNLLKGWK